MKTRDENEREATLASSVMDEQSVKIKTVLVPIDFSPASLDMLDYAAALARRFQATVHFVHVYPPDEAALVPGAGDLMFQTAETLFRDRLPPHHRGQVASFRPQNCHVRSGIAYLPLRLVAAAARWPHLREAESRAC